MNTSQSGQAFTEALQVMPGGVNSPVRSFKSIGIPPIFVKRAEGSRLYDVDGNVYTDYCLSWGVGILGHAHPAIIQAAHQAIENGTSYGAPTLMETELAQLLCNSTAGMDKVRLVNSGTEAVMSAIRLARAFTGKDIILKFNGCYHGHSDMLLVKAGSGVAEHSDASSKGVPAEVINHTLSIPYNNTDTLEKTFEKLGDRIAAVILEPVPANMGVILPQPGYMELIRSLTKKHASLLIFDEVITGFRFGYGGVQKLQGIQPDITTYGKIIGGGLPVGAYGANAEIMSLIAPDGPVYQAGTLAGNPVAVSAGIATLNILKNQPVYEEIAEKADPFLDRLKELAQESGIQVNSFRNMFTLFFSEKPVHNFQDAQQADHELFSRFYIEMLRDGIYLSPSGFEANFISRAHSSNDLERTLEAIRKNINKIRNTRSLKANKI